MTNERPPVTADDFKVITGIGPAIERRLHEAGILTFAQLATMSSTDIAKLVEGLAGMSVERISQQDWIGQARKLAPEPVLAESPPGLAPPGNRQHYATFTVELLLDEDNNVRRTRVVHIQDGDTETWAGWKSDRMVKFVTQHAALELPAAEPPPPVAATVEPVPPVAATAQPAPTSTAPAGLGGVLSLQALETVLTDTGTPHSVLPHDQPFNMHLTLDLTKVTAPSNGPLNYTAAVYAKNLNGSPRQTVGEAHGTTMPKDLLAITMAGRPLPRGIYRLTAVATLTLPPAEPGLTAHLEGGILQIY